MVRRNTKKKKVNINLRFNILTVLIYIVGIVLIARLFSLQIVHGAEYREQSNTRLTRETVLKAARGNLLDASGNKLVSTRIIYNVEIHKTKIDIARLLDQLVEEFYPMLEEKNLKLEVNKPSILLYDADGDKLARAFGNLLKNAICYGYQNTTITIDVYKNEKEIEMQYKFKRFYKNSYFIAYFALFKGSKITLS